MYIYINYLFEQSWSLFRVAAANVYFVQRIPDKPYGWWSLQGKGFEKPGYSFTLDPFYHNPNDPVRQLLGEVECNQSDRKRTRSQ